MPEITPEVPERSAESAATMVGLHPQRVTG